MAEQESLLGDSPQQWEMRCVGTGTTKGTYAYEFDEVTSSMQKMIRANKPYEACYWAFILHDSGYYKYVWKRLTVIATEDCGETPEPAMVVNALRQNYDYAVDAKARASDKIGPNSYIFQAVDTLCKAPKNRQFDTLGNLFGEGLVSGQVEKLPIPEIALDPHTAKGKAMFGRWNDGTESEKMNRLLKWANEWSVGTPVINHDPYWDKMKEIWGIE